MKPSVKQSAFFASIVFLVFATGLPAARSIPAGTILPVRLNSTVSSANSHTGQVITARVMQDVPLPGFRIHAGAKVIGHVVSVTPASHASPASISLKFDTLEMRGEKIPITTNLRAIASFVAVEQAQIPDQGADRGTPDTAWTTTQIGGDDTVYRGGGHVEGVSGAVGEPVYGGVLSHLYASPDGGCRGAIDADDALQALWVFSSDACGAYGLPNLTIRHTGRTDPVGKMTLDATTDQVRIQAGAGLLLRVNASETSGA